MSDNLLDKILPSFLNPVATAVSTVVDRLIPDNNAAAKLKDEIALELNKAQIAGQLAQIDVNKVEAANTNWFVSGWRPFIGWVCGLSLFSQMILRPFFMYGAGLLHNPTDFPSLDLTTLMTLLFGMLGLAGLRTTEKLNKAET